MFDIIGYWGVLTMTLMFPILVLAWLFGYFTNARVKELGGAPISIFSRFDKKLEGPAIGIPVVLGCFVSVVISAVWAIAQMAGHTEMSFISWHSTFSEKLSPVSGFVIAAVVAMIAYDMALKAYVKVNKLVTKLEEKA